MSRPITIILLSTYVVCFERLGMPGSHLKMICLSVFKIWLGYEDLNRSDAVISNFSDISAAFKAFHMSNSTCLYLMLFVKY